MATVSFEHADEVRAALAAIVTDPAHGPQALSSPRVMASLLGDLLPDAPRESGLLTAAVQRDVAGMLREHVSSGLDADVAVRLSASAFARSTAFTPEACQWVAAELAIALGLAVPPGLLDHAEPLPFAEPTAPEQVPGHDLPTLSKPPLAREVPGARPVNLPADRLPYAPHLQGPVPVPPGVPQPPRDSGWRLAVPLPGPYGTRDCPRCGRRLARAAIGKPHTSPGRLWCPGISGIYYANRGGYLEHVDRPEPIQPEIAEPVQLEKEPQAASSAPERSAAERLAEIARLHAAGLLTDQEYQHKRQEIIRQL